MIESSPIINYVGELNPFEEVDYQETAKELVTAQFENKDVFNRYLTLLLSGRVELQTVLKALIQQRSLDSAVGAQLDIIGNILGQPRQVFDSVIIQYFGFDGATGASAYRDINDTTRTFGYYKSIDDPSFGARKLTDIEYRRLLKLKILKNTGNANITSFNDGLRLLFNVGDIDYQEDVPINYTEGSATITVSLGRNFNDPEQSAFQGLDEITLAERFLNRPLGVGILYQDPITFHANFQTGVYEQFVFGSNGLTPQTFDDLFDFTRPYTDTYYDSSGVLQTAAVDEPRIGYDQTTLEPLGLHINGPDEVLTHTWGLEANDSQGTIRVALTHDNSAATEVAMVFEAADMKLVLFRDNTYWKLRVETQNGADSYEALITQYPTDSVVATFSYTPSEVSFYIEDEARLISITTDYGDTNIRTFNMRIGGTFTTNVGDTYNHFNGKIEQITYLRPYVSNGGKVVVDGMQITTEQYDKILTEFDDILIV